MNTISGKFKRLSAESFKSASGKPPENLSVIAKGFESFSECLTKRTCELFGSSLKILFLECTKAQIRPVVAKEGAFPGITHLLISSQSNQVLRLTLDRGVINMLSDLAFGGEGKEQLVNEARPPSNIEHHLARKFLGILSSVVPEVFQFLSGQEYMPLTSDAAPPVIFKPSLTAHFECVAKSLKGHFQLDVSENFVSELNANPSQDVDKSLASQKQTDVLSRLDSFKIDLTVVMSDVPLTVGFVANFKVGQVIALGTSLSSAIRIYSGTTILHKGHLGQMDGHYSVVIDD
jgi:flagellar motor switch protein FliM